MDLAAAAAAPAPAAPGPVKGKGKGGGKGGAPPPPKPGGAPKPKAKPLAAKPGAEQQPGGGGIAALQMKVQAVKDEMDDKHGTEIEGVDLSGIDPDAKGATFICPRCEKEVLESMRGSHMSSHSAEILPWLFLGAARNADNGKELTVRTGITHILNVAHETNQDHDARDEWQLYNREKGVPYEYKKFSWYDTRDQDIIKEMEGPMEFICESHAADPANRILVHCIQGISRSASVIICYLMKYERMSLKEAFEHTKARRAVVEPRREFLDQLARYECVLFGLERPTLTSEDVYAGKILLNVD